MIASVTLFLLYALGVEERLWIEMVLELRDHPGEQGVVADNQARFNQRCLYCQVAVRLLKTVFNRSDAMANFSYNFV